MLIAIALGAGLIIAAPAAQASTAAGFHAATSSEYQTVSTALKKSLPKSMHKCRWEIHVSNRAPSWSVVMTQQDGCYYQGFGLGVLVQVRKGKADLVIQEVWGPWDSTLPCSSWKRSVRSVSDSSTAKKVVGDAKAAGYCESPG